MDRRVKDLWDRVTGFSEDGPFPAIAFREEVIELHAAVADEKNRVRLLEIFHLLWDKMEDHLIETGGDLWTFQQQCKLQYYIFLREETYVNGVLSMKRLRAVTAREILARRMSPDDSLRRYARDRRRFLADFRW